MTTIYISDKERRLEVKNVVLHYYSLPNAPKPMCVKCGFSDIRALSLDHINGDGYKQRQKGKSGNASGASWYVWLLKRNLPSGFQTLCMNCQWIKRFENDEQPWQKRYHIR